MQVRSGAISLEHGYRYGYTVPQVQSVDRVEKLVPAKMELDHLIPAVITFGVVLEHSPMHNVRSFEKMIAMVVIPDLANIPLHIYMWERAHRRDIKVVVHSWVEKPIAASTADNTTPPLSVFNKVRRDNLLVLSGITADMGGEKEVITIEYDTLFAIWVALPIRGEKDQIEATLRCSPLFEVKERERVLRHLASIKGKAMAGLEGPQMANPPLSQVLVPQQEPPVQVQNGEQADKIIMQSINCDLENLEHASDVGSDVQVSDEVTSYASPISNHSVEYLSDSPYHGELEGQSTDLNESTVQLLGLTVEQRAR